MQAGQALGSIFQITRGQCDVNIKNACVGIIHENEIFGEMSFLLSGPATASVIGSLMRYEFGLSRNSYLSLSRKHTLSLETTSLSLSKLSLSLSLETTSTDVSLAPSLETLSLYLSLSKWSLALSKRHLSLSRCISLYLSRRVSRRLCVSPLSLETISFSFKSSILFLELKSL